jgi:hypothetical protein
MQDTGRDHALEVTGDGEGLVGHAGAVLLRKLGDQAGLTGALGPALARAGKSPLIDRGIALVSMAVAIALGATSMTDIALLAHHAPVLDATLITCASSTRKEPLPRSRWGTASIRCGPGVPIPPSRWRCCCGRATPDQIPSSITPRC